MAYNQKELQMGTRVEMEHTQDTRLAQKIAMDHLREDPHYYSKLKAAGLEECGDPSEPIKEPVLKSSDLGSLTPGQAPNLHSSDLMECGCPVGGCDCEADPFQKVSIAVVAPAGAGGEAQPTTPLTSSGLGKAGVPKPLTSDKLQAPKGDNILPKLGHTPPKVPAPKNQMFADSIADEEGNPKTNSIRVAKTPLMGGSDAMDVFGSQIEKALKPEIPSRIELIPANIYESTGIEENFRVQDDGKHYCPILGADGKIVFLCAWCDVDPKIVPRSKAEKESGEKYPLTKRYHAKGFETSHGMCKKHIADMRAEAGKVAEKNEGPIRLKSALPKQE